MLTTRHLYQWLGIVVIMLFAIGSIMAQIDVEGRVIDASTDALPSASVLLLSEKDSVMVGFGVSNSEGRFRVEDVNEGSYILQVSFLGFLDHTQSVVVEPNSRSIDVGNISMMEGNVQLDGVTITSDYIPVKMNHDTIQYNAAAFSVGPNAVVEDLLKKLPGVEVRKDGSIKAQGETVDKVLVEGKEFFGNDPTIATKNLPADAVDKVEVFDKKSDMAEFSGIDDGMEQKTINLSLKEDRKKGFFGNGKGGYGTDNRYDGKFNINSFSGDATWTALGMANNVNEQGFSIMDYIDFMGGMGGFMGAGGEVRINSGDLGMPVGQDLGSGFVKTHSGGLNYNHDLSKKTELSGSYFYSRIENDIDRNTTRQSILNQESFNTSESALVNSLSNGHSLNFKLQSKIDSSQRLTIRGNAGWNVGRNSVDMSRLLTSNERLENELMSSNRSDGDRFNFGINTTYSKKLGKNGRILSVNANVKDRSITNQAMIQSLNTFYPVMGQAFIDTLNQRQAQNNDALDYQLSLSFTQPIGRARYLEFSYNHQNIQNDLTKDFYDIIMRVRPEETFNEQLSNLFERGFLYNRVGLRYKVNRRKYNFMAGINLQHSDQKGHIGQGDFSINQDYFSVLPEMRYSLDIHSASSISLNYFTSIREPSLEQLQPQVDNSDPLLVYQGNPSLRPEYRHSLNIDYHTFNSFSQVSFFNGLRLEYIKDKITNSQLIDENFVQTIKPVNVGYDLTASAYFSLTTPLRPFGLKTELSSDLFFNKGILFINQVRNNTSNWTNRYTLTFENRKKKHVDWLVGATVGHNARNYSNSDHLDQTFLNYNYFTDVSKHFGDKWYFKTSFDYSKFPSENFGSATDLAIWKASLSMNFLARNRGQLTLSVVDILNQNKGINRSTQLNYFQDERIVSLGRYAMLSFGYSFSGFGKKENIVQISGRRR